MMKTFCAALASLLVLAATASADPLTRSVQEKLKDQGFYYGKVDGKPGPETTAALKRFQIRNGLPVTGSADLETTKALGVAGKESYQNAAPQVNDSYRLDRDALRDRDANRMAPPPQVSQAAPPQSRDMLRPPAPANPSGLSRIFARTPYESAPPSLQAEMLRRAQFILRREGYYRGALDGIPGPRTEAAIVAYQRDRRLAGSARLDLPTLAAMDMLPRQVPPPRHYHAPYYQGFSLREIWGN
jgi:peptidoglycan hydrolase-like protein with peptidoglycan-binding domain